uniref:Uncharacterized protein n=1 Tax=Pithovirus LCDPAC01 TaxID=2506600 RepID=A0A481YNP1_9VIRU|nr:MAG: hypothetical protein LCDPAC01_01970 [Pithovirus LCDPAC01]
MSFLVTKSIRLIYTKLKNMGYAIKEIKENHNNLSVDIITPPSPTKYDVQVKELIRSFIVYPISQDKNSRTLRAHLSRMGIKDTNITKVDVPKSIREHKELIFYGKTSELVYVYHSIITEYKVDDFSFIPYKYHDGYFRLYRSFEWDDTKIVSYPNGTSAVFLDTIDFNIQEELMRYISIMSKKTSSITRKNVDKHRLYDLINIIDPLLVKSGKEMETIPTGEVYQFGEYVGIISYILSDKELRLLFDHHTFSHDIKIVDTVKSYYALYLLHEDTSYLYDIRIKNGRLYMSGTTRGFFERFVIKYSSLLAKVDLDKTQFVKISSLDEAVSIASEYKCFVVNGDVYVAVNDDKSISPDVDSFREGLLKELELKSSKYTTFELALLYVGETLPFKFDTSSISIFFYFEIMGYESPNNDLSEIDTQFPLLFKEYTKEGKIYTQYYYESSSGKNIVVEEARSMFEPKKYNELNTVFIKGRYFNKKTYSIFLERMKILSENTL